MGQHAQRKTGDRHGCAVDKKLEAFMKLKNTTGISNALVKEVLRFVMPPGVTRLRMGFSRTRVGSGHRSLRLAHAASVAASA